MFGMRRLEKLWTSTCAGDPGVELASAEGVLVPMAFFAKIWKSYEVPFDKLVTVVAGVVPTPSLNTDHVPPLESLYWTI